MNHIEKLNWRYATKKFDESKKLSDDKINKLAEALRLSASSFGLQPWKFLIISNEDLKKELLPHSWNQEQVVNCSHHIIFCGVKNFGEKEVQAFIEDTAKTRGQSLEDLEGYKGMMTNFLSYKSDEEKDAWVKNQVYIALGSFMVTCAEMEIDACPMEGIVQKEYDKVLGLAEKGLTSIVACPVGFRSEDDKYAGLPKVRFSTEHVVEFLK